MYLIFNLFYLILQFPHFLFVKIIDIYKYFRYKEWKIFKGYGLHIYVGMFGSGKTSSMVHDAYCQAKRYKDLTILTNMKLKNFPSWTKIITMTDTNDIVTAPPNTLVLIDEISTVFNSRKYKTDGIPVPLLGMLLQVRKERKMIYATAQRFQHVDALLRQITFSVRSCTCWFGRWNWIYKFDAWDYENRTSPLVKIPVLSSRAFIQTNKVRELYDTMEMVEEVKKIDFMSNEEILERQGNGLALNISTAPPKKGLFKR